MICMITLATTSTTKEMGESVLFQPVLKAYPMHHSWIITAHVSLGHLECHWKYFNRQVDKTHQLLLFLSHCPAAPTHLFFPLQGELNTINDMYDSSRPIIISAINLLNTDPSFNGHMNSNTHHKRSLLPFLGDALRWLTGTVTTKDVNSIKKHVNQLNEIQLTQQKTLVHIVPILNVTRYVVQVIRHSINVLKDKVDETSQDVNNPYNLTTSLATSLSYHQLILYIRSVLANLLDSLSYIKTVSTHTMDYIDAATAGTLSPHILPEETLPSTLHLPVSPEDTLHFYPYLCTHVLITDKQFLLLINIPIQDRSKQLSIHKSFTLEVAHGNFTACYDINAQYLRITQDETIAVEISPTTVQNMSRSKWTDLYYSYIISAAGKPTILYYSFYARNTASISARCSLQIRCQYALTACTKCLDFNDTTLSSNHQDYPHMPGRNNTVHWNEKTHPCIASTHSLQCYITKFSSTSLLWKSTLVSKYIFGYGKP